MKREPVKTVTYYAPYARQAFDVPVRGADGKQVPLKDNQGNQRYYKGRPMWQEKAMEFQPQITVRTNSSEPLSFYRLKFYEKIGVDGNPVLDEAGKPVLIPEEQDVYEALEKLADDPGTKIEREASYKQRANPQAFEKEKELIAAKDRIAELEKLAERPAVESNDVVAEMLEENKRLKSEIEQLTAPVAKGKNAEKNAEKKG